MIDIQDHIRNRTLNLFDEQLRPKLTPFDPGPEPNTSDADQNPFSQVSRLRKACRQMVGCSEMPSGDHQWSWFQSSTNILVRCEACGMGFGIDAPET